MSIAVYCRPSEGCFLSLDLGHPQLPPSQYRGQDKSAVIKLLIPDEISTSKRLDSVFDFVSGYILNPFSVFPIYFRLRVFLSVPILLGELVSKWNWNALEGCFLFIELQISTTALETIWLIYTLSLAASIEFSTHKFGTSIYKSISAPKNFEGNFKLALEISNKNPQIQYKHNGFNKTHETPYKNPTKHKSESSPLK